MGWTTDGIFAMYIVTFEVHLNPFFGVERAASSEEFYETATGDLLRPESGKEQVTCFIHAGLIPATDRVPCLHEKVVVPELFHSLQHHDAE